MKIYFSNQKDKLKDHLEYLKNIPVMKYDRQSLKEKVTSIIINHDGITSSKIDFFLNYEIFPENILIFKSQWQHESRSMQVGDTIVQQAFIPPVSSFSQKIIFGVRINEIIREKSRIGFSYETLEGHVEKGISTFNIEESGPLLIFKIHTFSAPGTLLSKLAGPLFSIPYQAYCTQKALVNVKTRLEN